MTLSRLLEGVPVRKLFQTMFGRMVVTHEVEVKGIQYDSRKISRGDMFVAIRGEVFDGHRFIQSAVSRGASVVVVEDDTAIPDSFFMHAGVVKVVVEDARIALALLSANFFDHPSRKLRVVGVTGTNGKTSTTHLISSILTARGETVGLIGTIEYRIGGEVIPAVHTTPESLELNQLFAAMVQKGCTSAVMEVSSHSLALSRVHALRFNVGVFTNLTRDHLDFHGSMEEYFAAKKLLFDSLEPTAYAVTNTDDANGGRMVETTRAHILTYGTAAGVDVAGRDIDLSPSGTRFTVVYRYKAQRVESTLVGRFNVQNILAAYSAGIALGVDEHTIVKGIANTKAVRGRFDRILSPKGWAAIVDYAHTPDALENCLRAIRDILPAGKAGRVITVFGCGGDRDRGKRPLMGKIASRLSDITILTSDNPRKEDPESIINEIMSGVSPGTEVMTEVDRRKAIVQGLRLAEVGDIVLIAGKGHENYQVIGDEQMHFDDREEVEAFIRNGP